MTGKNHWEKVYAGKRPQQVSWYQEEPSISLELISATGITHSGKIIDVGGGASVLVDRLLDTGFKDVTVLDVSSKAIAYAKERLGERAANVNWIEADITEWKALQAYDFWHDRAVFHFLTQAHDRKKYTACLEQSVRPSGHAMIAAFSLSGPSQCSGLDVERYSPEKMTRELGDSFDLVNHCEEVHVTPWNAQQRFVYCLFRKKR